MNVLHIGFLPGQFTVPTTTIRIDQDLKARIAAAAERAGKTAHGVILDAITQTVAQDEVDAAFHRVADERRTKLLETGQTVPWDDAKTWLEACSRDEPQARPAPCKPGR